MRYYLLLSSLSLLSTLALSAALPHYDPAASDLDKRTPNPDLDEANAHLEERGGGGGGGSDTSVDVSVKVRVKTGTPEYDYEPDCALPSFFSPPSPF
ncbi:hypothetical protein JCM11641_006032 [Rhodosporidiobolus odoratus]